jgi:hypothetical protein
MLTPDHSGFIGFDGARIAGTSRDLLALDPVNGVERFEAHFRQEGGRHAAQLVRELCNTLLLNVDRLLFDLDEALRTFTPSTPAQFAYTEGFCGQLAYYADALRGVVALRELSLPSTGVINGDPALVSASDMPHQECLTLAENLDDISGRLSSQAGIALPARLQQRQWSVAPSRTDTAGKAARPRPTPASDGQSHSRNVGKGLDIRPGTAGGRHVTGADPHRRGHGRS